MIQVGRSVVVLLSCWPATTSSPRTSGGARLDGAHRRALGGRGLTHDAARAGPVGGGAAAGLHRTAARLHGVSVPGLGRSPDRGVDDRGRTPRRAVPALRDRRPGGESILLTGATFADLDPSAGTVTAFVVAFAGSLGAVADLLRSRGSARKLRDRGRRRPGPPGTLRLHLLPCADGGWDHRPGHHRRAHDYPPRRRRYRRYRGR